MKTDNIETDMLYNWFEEYSEIYIKILDILKKCNLHDLRTIFEALAEMGFKEKS